MTYAAAASCENQWAAVALLTLGCAFAGWVIYQLIRAGNR